MKKLTTLALAAGLIVAAAAPASAVDTKVDGQYVFTFQRAQTGFTGIDNEFAKQRLRLGLTFTASENLSGYAQFQTQEGWGALDGATAAVEARQAYIDWMVPGTPVKVRMGKFGFGIPAEAFAGSQCMAPGTIRSGIQVTAPVADFMSVTAFWNRQKGVESSDVSAGNNGDAFGVLANMKFDGVALTPWALANFSQNGAADPRKADELTAVKTSQTYWAGLQGTLTMFDPLTVKAAFGYGYREFTGATIDRDGWYAQVNAFYKMSFGTPSFGFWYGSGDDKDVAYAGQNWVPTMKGKFAPSTTYYANEAYLAGGQAFGNIAGTWGLKLGLNGVSFLDGLTHDFAVVMINGTNHDDAKALGTTYGNYLTWSDTVYEFDFDTTYQIYKNLGAKLELAYVINDLDDQATKDENDWRAALSFEYKF